MNKNMKKILTSLFGITLAVSLSACGAGGNQPAATTPAEPEKKEEAPAAEEKALTIGITQIVEHPALDAAKKGFVDYLNENGFAEGEKGRIRLPKCTRKYGYCHGDCSEICSRPS